MQKENQNSINSNRRKLLSLAGVAGAGTLLSPLISKAAPSTIIEAGSNVDTASYIIFQDSGTIFAKNGTTGKIDFQNADASAVIQSAISILTNGGKIFIKTGTYNISNAVQIKANIIVTGEGYSTILRNNGSGPIFQFIEGYGTLVGVTIEKMSFKGGGSGTGPAIQTKSKPPSQPYSLTDHMIFRDLSIQMNSDGIYMPSRVEFTTFENVRTSIAGCTGYGINANFLAACSFRNCDLSNNGGDGLHVEGGVGNIYTLYQAAANKGRGVNLLNELNSVVNLMYSEANTIEGLYINGSSCQVNMFNITDKFTIASQTISYTTGYETHMATESPYQSKPDYLWVQYAIRPKTTTNGASFPLQKYQDGNFVDVAIIGNGAFEIYNMRTYSGNYGGDFSTFTLPSIKGKGHCFFAEDTNAANPGKRLYASFDGTTWNYSSFV